MKQIALIGVSGYGGIYYRFLKELQAKNKLKIAAVIIRNIAKVKDIYDELLANGTRVFASEEEMYAEFNNKLDLVCIPTGIEFHERMTLNALKNGANVLIEKPVAGSLREVERMIEAEKQSKNLFVAVGFQHMYAEEIQMIKRRLVANEFGKILKISCVGAWPRNDLYYQRNNWAGKKFASDNTPVWDSPVNNAFAHFLNISLFLGGKTFEVSSMAKVQNAKLLRARRTIETFDSCALELVANNILIKNFFSHTVKTVVNPKILIECENGLIEWGDEFWKFFCNTGTMIDSGIVVSPHQRMFETIISKLDNINTFCYSLEVAKNHTKVIEELQKFPIIDVPLENIWRRASDGQLIVDNIIDDLLNN